jgi:hypothetical protein
MNRIQELVALHKKHRNTGDGYAEELAEVAEDLLTALLLYISSGIGNSTDFEKQREAYSAARAAIAKAKGDQ